MSSDEKLETPPGNDAPDQPHASEAAPGANGSTREAEPTTPTESPVDGPDESAAAAATEPVTGSPTLPIPVAPVPAESPATDAPATDAPAASVETSETSPASTAETERPRPRLNPTGADQARPIPNVPGSIATPMNVPAPAAIVPPVPVPTTVEPIDTAAPGAESDSSTETAPIAAASSDDVVDESVPTAEEVAVTAKSVGQDRPAGPVEVPRDDDLADLDASLEAEIAAAMSTDEAAEAAAVAAATAAAEAAQSGDEDGESDDDSEQAVVTPSSDEDLTVGARLNAKIQSIHGDNVFVDLGTRMNGVVTKRQFQSNRPAAVGQIIQVVVEKIDEEEGLVQCSLPKGVRRVSGNWDQLAVGQVVECYVNKTNKGGLDVAVSGIRAFLPSSQIDIRFVEDTEVFVGQKLRVQVTEVNPKKRNLVVSRRAILQEERAEAEKTLWQALEKGQQLTGTVKTIKPYGAFVDIGGTDGFLHVGEISWNRINDPSEVLQVGQKVDVQVLKLDPEAKKISLGMKQLAKNPWSTVAANYAEGTTVHGKVTRTAEFGAFVELEEGVEGLVHISELDHARVRRVTDVLNVGQEVDVRVLEVDSKRRRVSLSLKALTDKPVPPKDEDLSPGGDEAYVRKHKGPLKGGTGPEETGGGLFGNPDAFGG